MPPGPAPSLVSGAFDDIPFPHFADVVVVPVPGSLDPPPDPRSWGRAVFDLRRGPRWVLALLLARQALSPLIGIPPAPSSALAVDEVRAGEALIRHDDVHLDYRVGVAYDQRTRLLRVVTVVRTRNVRGRLYFLPVALLHGPVTRALARSAVRRLTSG